MDFTNTTLDDYISLLMVAAGEWALREQRGNDFARGKQGVCIDMAQKLRRNRVWASERQKAYAQKLILWAQPRAMTNAHAAPNSSTVAFPERAVVTATPSTVTVASTAVARIRALFGSAASHNILRPKIRLRINVVGADAPVQLVLSRAAVHGRHPGSIYITTPHPAHGRQVYIGRISPEALFLPARECRTEHAAAIRMFGENPLAIARAHGRAVGSCCFCGRQLTDARSVAMGYGPICADHYGLEWGDQRASSVVTLPAGINEDLARVHNDMADGLVAAFSGMSGPITTRPQAETIAERRMRQQVDRGTYRPGGPPPEAADQSMDYTDEDELFK